MFGRPRCDTARATRHVPPAPLSDARPSRCQDRCGELSYIQLHALLSHGKAPVRPSHLAGLSAAEVARIPIPRGPGVQLALRHALAGRSARVVELLHDWDVRNSR